MNTTEHLLSTEANKKRLMESMAQVKAAQDKRRESIKAASV